MPITRVKLNGYKGQYRDLHLDGPTILNGPNGIGKSAVKESVVYALLGKVPEGRALDSVAHYFPARGGDVLLEDDRRNWITRGIKIDHAKKKKKISAVLDTSSTPQDARQVDLRDWEAFPAVLDLDELLALSPVERRKFVLKLCGEGEATPNLYQLIEDAYAKEICGPAAGSAIEVFARIDDLPEKEWALVDAWTGARGVGDTVESVTKGSEETLTQILLKAGQVATQSKLIARRAADEARKAIKELEAEAQGARAAASELRQRQREADQATEKLAVMRERRAAREEIRVELEGREKEKVHTAKQLEFVREVLSKTAEPGPEPKPKTAAGRRQGLRTRLKEVRAEAKKYRLDVLACRQDEGELDSLRDDIQNVDTELRSYEKEPIGKVSELVTEIPDEAHENVPPLKEEIAALSASWRDRRTRLAERWARLDKEIRTLDERLFKRRDAYDEAEAKLEEFNRQEKELQPELDGIDSSYRKEVAEWHEQGEGWYDAKRKVDYYEGHYEQLAKQEEDLRRRLDASGEESGVEEAESSHFKAKKLLEQAQKAAGAIEAYESVVERAERQTVLESAWKACERAVNAVRESEVFSSTRPLLATMNDFLSACGRPERAYLELENERGTSIFEMGWVAGDVKKALPALSDGEAVLFCAGLSLAVALRASGRRMLLIEADHLDQENLSRLLTGLLAYKDALEALIVATKTPLSQFDGWTVANLEASDAHAS